MLVEKVPAHAPGLGYFARFEDAFASAGESVGWVERDLSIGGRRVRLRFAGEALVDAITPALAHVLADRQGEPGAVIGLWDSASTGVAVPAFSWDAPKGDEPTEVRYNGERLTAVYNTDPRSGARVLSMFDAQSRATVVWCNDHGRLPWYERAAPLRSSLNWSLAGPRRHFAHGAVVSVDGDGVLLAGRKGSGKSTTALACIEAGLGYIGDDYVLLSMDGEPEAHSLYCTAKVNADSLSLVPGIARAASTTDVGLNEKIVLDLRGHRPRQLRTRAHIRALLVPRVTGGDGPTLRRASPAEGLRALAPSTIYQLPSSRGAALRPMADLARTVPTYVLELGGNALETPVLISDLLRRLA